MSAEPIQKQYAAGAEVNHTSPAGINVELIKYDDDTWAVKTATVPNQFNLQHTEPALTEALRLADQLGAKFLVVYQSNTSGHHARIQRIDVAKVLDQPALIERISDKLGVGQKITAGDITIERQHNKIFALTTTKPLTDTLKFHAVSLAQSVGATELMYVENASVRSINVQEGMTTRTALVTAGKTNDAAAAGKALADYVNTMQFRSFENDALWGFPHEFYTPDAAAIIKREFALHTTNPALIDTLGATLVPDKSPMAGKRGVYAPLPPLWHEVATAKEADVLRVASQPAPFPLTPKLPPTTPIVSDEVDPEVNHPLFEILSSNRVSKTNPIGTLAHEKFTIAKQNSVFGAIGNRMGFTDTHQYALYLNKETGAPSFREDKRGFGYISSAEKPDLNAIRAMLELAHKRFEGGSLRISGNQVFQKHVKELALSMGIEVKSSSFFERAQDFLARAPAALTPRPTPLKTDLENATEPQPTERSRAPSNSPMSP